MNKVFLLGTLLVLAFVFRALDIGFYPSGFTPDEASFGYDAYSILKTGHDQWGQQTPLAFRSFGDFKLPLYTYLAVPSVAAFGLNEFAVRLPNAIVGTLAVLFTYLLARSLFADRRVAFLAAFLLTVSPWHLSMSRGAFEANITTFLIPLGVWAYLKGLKKPGWLILAAFAFGLNLFSYHSARFFTPLLVVGLVWFTKKDVQIFRKNIFAKSAVLIFAGFLAFVVYSLVTGSSARAGDVAIFNPTDNWSGLADRRYQAVIAGLPDELSRIFSNKITYTVEKFLTAYVSYFSPQFLFTQGAGEWTYGMIPGHGVLYLFEAVFIAFAAYGIFKNKNKREINFVLLWLVLAPIPAGLAKGPGYAANRAETMIPALQMLSAYGGVMFYDFVTKKWQLRRKLLHLVLGGIAVASVVSFTEDYFFHAPINGAQSMLWGRGEAIGYASQLEGSYEKVVVSRSLSEPQIYVAFYKTWDPRDLQRESADWLRYEEEKRSFLDQLGEYHLGKYTFSDVSIEKYQDSKKVLLVGKANEFPANLIPLKTIYYPNLKDKALVIVDPEKVSYATTQ